MFYFQLTEERWVFDTVRDHWVTLNENEFQRLSFSYFSLLVNAKQNIVVQPYESSHRPIVGQRAHNYAYSKANHVINMLRATEAEKVLRGDNDVDDSIEVIKRR